MPNQKDRISALTRADKKKVFTQILFERLQVDEDTSLNNLPPNFEYTIIRSGVTIHILNVNGTKLTGAQVKASGKILVKITSPFYIHVLARLTASNGYGSLQIKDIAKNKNVFEQPKDFEFGSNGAGGIKPTTIKLP